MVSRRYSIGSPIWRLRNYGVIAAMKYLYFRRKRKNPITIHKDQAHSVYELNNKLFNFPNEFVDLLLEKHKEWILDLESRFKESIESGVRFKPGMIGIDASYTRLLVLAYVLSGIEIENVIETGTQHGVSSLYLRYFLDSGLTASKPHVVSFDVKESNRPTIKDVTFEILASPARKSFKEKTLSGGYQEKLLFFHDSDHSYENMMFEFKWAFKQLKALCIVSDDVDENFAFFDFEPKGSFKKVVCKFDYGSSVGVMLRE